MSRLKEFLAEADRRGIVVELTLFCSTYGEPQWTLHLFHPTNNAQAVPVPSWSKLHALPTDTGGSGRESAPTSPDGGQSRLTSAVTFAYQEKLTRYLVRELNGFDNLFFEMQNEPRSDNHTMGDFINPCLTDKHSFPNAVELPSPEFNDGVALRIIPEKRARLDERQ